MILVTVGTQFGFDRLIRWMDQWCARHQNVQVVAQIGRGEFIPKHMEWTRDISPLHFVEMVGKCDKIVSHAGMGTIISARLAGKPVIVVPRLASLHEHRNEHQLATAARFCETAGIYTAHEAAELFAHLESDNEGVQGGDSDRELTRLIVNLSTIIDAP